jgi:hypothetical protein
MKETCLQPEAIINPISAIKRKSALFWKDPFWLRKPKTLTPPNIPAQIKKVDAIEAPV